MLQTLTDWFRRSNATGTKTGLLACRLADSERVLSDIARQLGLGIESTRPTGPPSPADLIGPWTGSRRDPGPLLRAMRAGHWLHVTQEPRVLLETLLRLHPIAAGMPLLLEQERDIVRPAPGFRIVVTGLIPQLDAYPVLTRDCWEWIGNPGYPVLCQVCGCQGSDVLLRTSPVSTAMRELCERCAGIETILS